MKANVKNKVKISDKIAGKLFEEIIDVLLNKYHKSDEKVTMSFEEYCIALKELSITERKKKGDSE